MIKRSFEIPGIRNFGCYRYGLYNTVRRMMGIAIVVERIETNRQSVMLVRLLYEQDWRSVNEDADPWKSLTSVNHVHDEKTARS